MKQKIAQLYTEPITFIILCATIACCLVLYIYLIRQTVFNVVKRQEFESQLSALQSKIANLEAQNIFMKNSINLNTAHALGFQESSSLEFIKRSSLGKAEANRNEI